MKARALAPLLAAVAVVGAAAAWRDAGQRTAAETRATERAAAAEVAAESGRRDRDIAFWERRSAEDSLGAFDRGMLAGLYLQRSRQTGDYADVLKAEEYAHASLAIRGSRNAATVAALVSAYLSEHRFAEAREAALRLVADEPKIASYRAMLGEVDLEVGDYAGARAAFDSIPPKDAASLGIAPRVARYVEIRGATAAARRTLYRAMAEADRSRLTTREQTAWFHLRAGDIDLRNGRLDDAERAFRSGRLVLPNDHRLLAAQARAAALRHDWARAIALGDSAIATVLDPATIGLVGEAHAALGDTAKAEEYYRTMEVSVVQQPGAYHRAWSLFLLDHGRRVSEVTAQVERELETRKDIYGYDLLAWARYRQGRYAEARRAEAKALSQGTKDGLLFYHMGTIERAAGRPGTAKYYLERALETNPTFDVTHPAAARATLDSLRREGVE